MKDTVYKNQIEQSIIELHNENCFITMNGISDNSIDVILTSPPYNTGRTIQTEYAITHLENRYDIHLDDMTEDEYINWTIKLFNSFDKILKPNGTILYNISYGSENNVNGLWLTIADIIKKTNFMCADCLVWKKCSALPNNASPNKLTRITEFIFVFCRKNEYGTFKTNKKIKSTSNTGQNFYENIFNFIEAKNNDGTCPYNKATYSSELCDKLLKIYCPKDATVYDPFMGTGTTAISCINFGVNCIGSEISENQFNWEINRIENNNNIIVNTEFIKNTLF